VEGRESGKKAKASIDTNENEEGRWANLQLTKKPCDARPKKQRKTGEVTIKKSKCKPLSLGTPKKTRTRKKEVEIRRGTNDFQIKSVRGRRSFFWGRICKGTAGEAKNP